MSAGLLVIMGSGETAPTMVKPHRAIFQRCGDRPAVLLDTPYGFQENAADISARAGAYFAASVGRQVDVVSWRTPPAAGLDRERALAALDQAGWLFAGPGSPTYALRQWHDTPIPGVLSAALERDAVVVFASAAALTLGSHTVPVYEIYKAGIEPVWVPGLDLVRQVTGLPAVVIPHYDNAEGGHHDTRFCYLGERRLAALERSLPEEAFVLGVDEHTAVLLDLAERTATVVGNGVLTIRRQGASRVYPTGSTLPLEALAEDALASVGSFVQGQPAARAAVPTGDADPGTPGSVSSLRGAAEAASARFDAAVGARDVDQAVAAVLALEQAIADWSTDTLTSDEGSFARSTLRRMVLRLGEVAVSGARDPRTAVTPFVDALLELRSRARTGRDFATGDWIREQLSAAGVEVRDTPSGATWQLS